MVAKYWLGVLFALVGAFLSACSGSGQQSMGALGSTHIHADYKVYINGNAWDFSPSGYYVRSRYAHVEPSSTPGERPGDVLHVHATGVPLNEYFKSIGWDLGSQCLKIETGESYCTNETHSLKFLVNREPRDGYGSYVPKHKDRILVSYGLKDEDVSGQMESVTSFGQTSY